MGCEVSKPTVVATGREDSDSDTKGFTETQIDTIRSTWPLLAGDMVRVGSEVFSRIFGDSLAIRSMFENFSVYNIEDLQFLPVFQEHAGRFMQTLESVVNTLENPNEGVKQELRLLGAHHSTYEGFRADFFQIYVKCLLEVWETELGEEFIQEVRKCWKLFFGYIVAQMVDGYEKAMKDIKMEKMLTNSDTPENSVIVLGGKKFEVENS